MSSVEINYIQLIEAELKDGDSLTEHMAIVEVIE